MSGIVALFQRNGAPVDLALLHSMNEAQRFRGPDGEETWHEGPVGLGHTLHKTTLEAEREVSPTNLDGRLFITADARIDARDELCEQLRGRGIHVRTDLPDPELLLHAYDAWGEDFLQHVLGDFSFALWDAPNHKLVCAVDQLGVKPLFYADRGGLFAASNSLECVRKHPQVRSELNEIAVGDFLLFGCYQTRDITIYQDIARIPPGHYLVVESGGVRLQQYFSLPEPKEVQFAKQSDVIEQFQELLGKAVRDRLRTPRVAVYMSGGVDSPLVALTAKRELAKAFGEYEIGAFTLGYDWLIPDQERYYAGLVGKCLGIPVDFQALDDADPFDHRHAPSTQPVSPRAWELWRAQRARIGQHFCVTLTGFDGDALLLSSPHLHWAERLRQGRLGSLIGDLSWYIRNQRALPPLGIRTRIARMKQRRSQPAHPSWLREDFSVRTSLATRWECFYLREAPLRSRERSPANFGVPAWGDLFDDCDAARFRVPLEIRHPLTDLRLLRFAFGLAAVPWCVNKHLLRSGLSGLPTAVCTRAKAPLRTDPVLRRFERDRVKNWSSAWRVSALGAFVDATAVARALAGPPPPSREVYPLLRAAELGHWLHIQACSTLAYQD